MKIKRKKEGDIRIRRFFALFPVFCGDDCRWLEWVKVKQECRRCITTALEYGFVKTLKYVNIEFL